MARTRQEMIDIVRDIIREDTEIADADIISCLEKAVMVYSQNFPKETVSDKAGDGSTYEWAVPTGWSPDFSRIIKVIYPADETGEREPPEIDPVTSYGIVLKTAGYYWRLYNITASTGDSVKFIYTAYYTLDSDTNDLSSTFAENSVMDYAAHLCFRQLQAVYSGYKSSNIGIDTVDYGAKSSNMDSLAKVYLQRSGLTEQKAGGIAIVIGDIDPYSGHEEKGEFLVHTRGKR